MKKYFSVISITCVLLASSCKKNPDIVYNYPPKPESKKAASNQLEKLFAQNAPKSQSFSIDAATGGSLSTSKNSTYTIPPNAFQHKDGSEVTGQVNVIIKEITLASEMILGDKPTVTSSGELLKSYGEFKVIAVQGTEELLLKPAVAQGGGINVAVNGPRIDSALGQKQNVVPMWNGDTVIAYKNYGWDFENNSVTITVNKPAKKGIDWTLSPDVAINTGSRLNFAVTQLGTWRNCDALYPKLSPITVIGYFNVFNDSAATATYQGIDPNLLFFKKKGDVTLVKLYNQILNPPAGKSGFLSYQNSFEVGMQGTFLAVVNKNGKFYAVIKDVTIAAPASGKNFTGIDFTLEEVTEAQLLALIDSMNAK